MSLSTEGTLGRPGIGTFGSESDGIRPAASPSEGIGIAGNEILLIDAIDAAACPGKRRNRSCRRGLPGSSS